MSTLKDDMFKMFWIDRPTVHRHIHTITEQAVKLNIREAGFSSWLLKNSYFSVFLCFNVKQFLLSIDFFFFFFAKKTNCSFLMGLERSTHTHTDKNAHTSNFNQRVSIIALGWWPYGVHLQTKPPTQLIQTLSQQNTWNSWAS